MHHSLHTTERIHVLRNYKSISVVHSYESTYAFINLKFINKFSQSVTSSHCNLYVELWLRKTCPWYRLIPLTLLQNAKEHKKNFQLRLKLQNHLGMSIQYAKDSLKFRQCLFFNAWNKQDSVWTTDETIQIPGSSRTNPEDIQSQ